MMYHAPTQHEHQHNHYQPVIHHHLNCHHLHKNKYLHTYYHLHNRSVDLSIYQSLILLLSTICYLSIYLSTNTEFLSTVRNLFDPIRPSRSTNWTAASVDVPLESDAIALEYLSAYDYDVSKAYFNIFCDMGCGKGPTYMHAYIHSCIYIHTNMHAFNGLYTNFDVLHGMMYV